jgi:hypothetical protein
MKRLVCTLACLFVLAAVGYAGTVPVTIYDTITGAPNSGLAYVAYPGIYNGFAASFSTIPELFTFTELDLILGPKAGLQPAGGGLNIYLFDDLATMPNNLVATIASVSDDSITGIAQYSFTGLNIPLAANSRYWIGVFPQYGSNTTSGWELTAPAPLSAQSQYTYDTADGVYQNSRSAPQMSISGLETVPEPSTLFLAAFGMSALVVWRRRSAAR